MNIVDKKITGRWLTIIVRKGWWINTYKVYSGNIDVEGKVSYWIIEPTKKIVTLEMEAKLCKLLEEYDKINLVE